MKIGSKALAIILLFVGLVLVNYLASSLPARIDSTADNIYSLSAGTKAMLGKVEEPVLLEYYFSKSAAGLPISYKNYAERVAETLRQYVRASGGKVKLTVIDPKPDTPEEEKATAAGLAGTPLGTGEQLFFGLVATQADQQKTIQNFVSNPQQPFSREPFLESEISKLIYSVQQFDKPKLGLLSSVPLQGTSPQEMQMMMMMRRQPQPSQFVLEELKQSFEIVTVEPTATELPANLDVLAVIHPQNLSPTLQFAIDQFLLGGKPVFLAVDPSSQHFKRQSNPQQAMMGGPQPNISSDLPALLGAYGVTFDPQKVVGDLENPLPIGGQGGQVIRMPTWLFLRKPNFSAKALPTANLNSAWFIEPGALSATAGSSATFTPLIETSAQSGDVAAMMLQFAQGEDISRQITPSGKKTIAALVTGKLKSAFPNGAPEEPKPADDAAKKEGDDAKKEEPKKETPKAEALKESKATSTLFVIADTDWLLDDYSLRKFNVFGQTMAEPYNDNLSLASNTLEFLGGSQDLISIRGKGTARREFTVVRRMETEAQKKYQEKLTALDAELSKLQADLSKLQGEKTTGNRLVATPEMAKRIEEFQKQQAAKRGERREIRRALREDIDALENKLLAINLGVPTLIAAFGLVMYFRRRR